MTRLKDDLWCHECDVKLWSPTQFLYYVLDEFNIYTREAGSGILSVAVEGPSQAKIEMVDNANGYTMVSYTVTKEGPLALLFADVHYPVNDQ